MGIWYEKTWIQPPSTPRAWTATIFTPPFLGFSTTSVWGWVVIFVVHVGCHITIPGGPNVKMKMKNTFCLLFLQSIFFFPMGIHVSFIFRGYISYKPYFYGLPPTFFMGFWVQGYPKMIWLLVVWVLYGLFFYVSCFGQDYTLCYVSWEMYQVYFTWPNETQEKHHGWLTYVGDCSGLYVCIYYIHMI